MTQQPGWKYDPTRMTLDYLDHYGRLRYDVDLEDMTTSAACLDWIFQVAGKGWCSDEALGQLVRQINQRLQPQQTLCSFGVEKGPINAAAILTAPPRVGAGSATAPPIPIPLPEFLRTPPREDPA
jgi:hypothetical protein